MNNPHPPFPAPSPTPYSVRTIIGGLPRLPPQPKTLWLNSRSGGFLGGAKKKKKKSQKHFEKVPGEGTLGGTQVWDPRMGPWDGILRWNRGMRP